MLKMLAWTSALPGTRQQDIDADFTVHIGVRMPNTCDLRLGFDLLDSVSQCPVRVHDTVPD
ncbi:MAG: hypothetical protein WCK47_12965 [bacterium]|nr:hypothetical protein [Candidatus Sumerlaeota bacterium]